MHNSLVPDDNKENKNHSNLDTKRTDKEESKKEEQPNPVMQKYFVKKTERPVFAQNILEDLAKIRA